MSITALRQLKKRHENALGRLRRELEFAPGQENAFLRQKYRLAIQTLFDGFSLFLQFQSEKSVNATEQKEYSEFFEQFSEVPQEVMVCGVIQFELTSGIKASHNSVNCSLETKEKDESILLNIRKISSDKATIHRSLQFAVIEYLMHCNQIANVDWYSIIKKLLQLGADPYFSERPDNMLFPEMRWLLPNDQLHSTVNLTFFKTNAHDKIVQLLEEYLRFNPGIRLTELTIKAIVTNVQPLSNPLIHWLEKNYLNEVKSAIYQISRKKVRDYAKNKDFASIEYLRTQYGVDGFNVLSDSTDYDTLIYLKNNYFERLKQHFEIEARSPQFICTMIQSNLIEILQLVKPDPHCYLKVIFTLEAPPHTIWELSSLQWIVHTHPQAVYDYFMDPTYSYSIAQQFESLPQARYYLAYQCNIDWLFYGNNFTVEDKANLNSYYQRRARFILDFINQEYLKPQENKPIVQPPTHLLLLVEKLELAYQSNHAADLFAEIYNMADHFIKTNGSDPHVEFYAALRSRLTNTHPLSQFARREFDVYRICVPFLSGLNDKRKLEQGERKEQVVTVSDTKTRVLSHLPQERLYSKQALSQIFRFLGNFGAKAAEDDKNSAEYRWCDP